MRINAVLTGLVGVLLVARSGDDLFWERAGIDPDIAGYLGLFLLLIAGLTFVLVLALYDRSRGARIVVGVLSGLRLLTDLAQMAGGGVRGSRAWSVIDLIFSLMILFFLFGSGAAEWFQRQPAPAPRVPPRPV